MGDEGNNLRLANNMVDDLTIKKLIYMFDEQDSNG
jgi:hypothetical protein